LKSDYVYSLQSYKHILMKVLCHNLKVLLFSKNAQDMKYTLLDKADLVKDRDLMPRLTAVWRIVWYGVVWFGTDEFDVALNAWFGELCGMW